MPSGVLSSSGTDGARRRILLARSFENRSSCSGCPVGLVLNPLLFEGTWPKVNLAVLIEIVPLPIGSSPIYALIGKGSYNLSRGSVRIIRGATRRNPVAPLIVVAGRAAVSRGVAVSIAIVRRAVESEPEAKAAPTVVSA